MDIPSFFQSDIPEGDGLPLSDTNRTGISQYIFLSTEIMDVWRQFYNTPANDDFSPTGQNNIVSDERQRIIDWSNDHLDTQLDSANYTQNNTAIPGSRTWVSGYSEAVNGPDYQYRIPSSLKIVGGTIQYFNNGEGRVNDAKAQIAVLSQDWAKAGLLFQWAYDQVTHVSGIFQMRSDQHGLDGNNQIINIEMDNGLKEILGPYYSFDSNYIDGRNFGINNVNGLSWYIQREYRTEQNMINHAIKNYQVLHVACLCSLGIGQAGFNIADADRKLRIIKAVCYQNAWFLARECEYAMSIYYGNRNLLAGEVDNTLYNVSSSTYLTEYSHKTSDGVQRERIFNFQAWTANIGCTMLMNACVCAYLTSTPTAYLQRSYKQFVKDFLSYAITSNYNYGELRRAITSTQASRGFYYHAVTMTNIMQMAIFEAMHERVTTLKDYVSTFGTIYNTETNVSFGPRTPINYETMALKHREYFDGTKDYYKHTDTVSANTKQDLFDNTYPVNDNNRYLIDINWIALAKYVYNNPALDEVVLRTGSPFSQYPLDANGGNNYSWGAAGNAPVGDDKTYRLGAQECDSWVYWYALKNHIDLFEPA